VIVAMEPQFPYREVADDLRDKIKSAELARQLPSRAKLAEEYGYAEMTIDRAIKLLKEEGLVYGIAGLGTFVR
jgi:DNA-binding GntR family transcriptional regulator